MISSGTEHTSKRPRGGERDDHVIPFFDKDIVEVHNLNNDIVIIDMMIEKYPTKIIMIDTRSSVYILFYNTFVHMDLPMSHLKPVIIPLVNFTGDSIRVEREIILLVIASSSPR